MGFKTNLKDRLFSFESSHLKKMKILVVDSLVKPKLKLDKVNFVKLDFHSVNFLNVNSILIDQTQFHYDYLIFASGGISNVYFLSEFRKHLAPRYEFLKNSIGMGYTNHIRTKILTIKFKKWVRLRPPFWRFKSKKLINCFDYLPAETDLTKSRISIRLWAVASKFPFHKVLQELGFYKQAEVVSYIELPQIRSNFVKFNRRNHNTLIFDFQYNFKKKVVSMISSRVHEISQLVSEDTAVEEVQLANYHLDSLLTMDSYHHFGGTRMGEDAVDSTVNTFGLVHGTSNIYVAGTSVLSRSFADHPTWVSSIFAIRSCLQILDKCDG